MTAVRTIRVETLGLDADPRTLKQVRAKTREWLEGWGLPGLVEDAQLIASELATNALRHGALPARFWLCIDGNRLLIEVTDGGETMPALREPDEDGGRGLTLVKNMAAAWGAEPLWRSKKVWASLVIDESASGDGSVSDPPTVLLKAIAA